MEKKTNLRLRVKIAVAFVWIGAVVALLSKALGTWCLVLGLVIAIAAAVYRYTMIRCPHCGHKLIDGKTVPAICPNCWEELI